jgi:branched-chain amino acid transport system substrate-binding protein
MTARRLGRIEKMLRAALFLCASAAIAGCGAGAPSAPAAPIRIGVSLSLSGDFTADGQAFQQGYELWADTVNAHGGLLGRQVQLVMLSDASDPQMAAANYEKLIAVDKVDLVFGPFSTLLTKAASVVADRYGYAFPEGAGGGPSVFARGLTSLFDVSLPVADNLASFAHYILSLPPAQRPTTAAYATEDDPFTQPQVDTARQLLEAGGVKTVSYQVYPTATTDYAPIAAAAIASGAQIFVAGTLLPDIAAFMNAFVAQHYNPQALIASAGPDQGSQFVQAVGASQTEGVFVPNGWYPGLTTFENVDMVTGYIAKYGGTPDGISADVAEAYSVGQVVAQAIAATHSLDNAALIRELHAGTFKSVQGAVRFDASGRNVAAQAFLFQWQKGTLVPVYPPDQASAAPEFPKPPWS